MIGLVILAIIVVVPVAIIVLLKPGEKLSLFGGKLVIKRREQFDSQAVKANFWWSIPVGVAMVILALWPLISKYF